MAEPGTRERSLRRRRVVLIAATAALLATAGIIAGVSSGGGAIETVTGPVPRPCTVEVRSLPAAAGEVRRARAGDVVCLAGGSYPGTLTLSGSHPRPVTLRSAPGAHVQTGPVTISSGGVSIQGLWIRGEVAIAGGVSFVKLLHDDITGGGEGVVFDTSDCTVANAPTWAGCEPQAPVSNVVISGNHFHGIGQSGSEDAIHLDNWRNVTVSQNEFDHIIESGNHTDCLQSVYGGTNLTFTRNYEHDNDCQGFFVKDGDATNVTVSDNLFVRDSEGSYADFAQIWNSQNLVVQRNTIWDGKGLALVADNASFAPTATIDHNLFAHFTVEKPVGSPYSLTEGHNIFSESPTGFRPSRTDRISLHPRFRNQRGGISGLRAAGRASESTGIPPVSTTARRAEKRISRASDGPPRSLFGHGYNHPRPAGGVPDRRDGPSTAPAIRPSIRCMATCCERALALQVARASRRAAARRLPHP